MPRRLVLLVCCAVLAMCTAVPARAQGSSGSDIITGTVVGPTGAPINGATVEVTSLETDVTRRKTTNADGRYTLLFPDGGGQYRVTVRYIGMTPVTFTAIR